MEHYKNLLLEASFTAIDFETANESRSSACAFGFARYRNGQVVNKGQYLIRQSKVTLTNYNVHGLSEALLADAPTFDEIWQEIETLLQNEILVAHNCDFDIDVLRQTCQEYKLPLPNFRYLCSQKLAQAAFGELKNYRLNDVAAFLDLPLNHHNCLSDAEVCGHITLKALQTGRDLSLNFEAEEFTNTIRKMASEEKKARDYGAAFFSSKKFSSDLLKPNLEIENQESLFFNKKVVFTGNLLSLSRKAAAEKVQALGADINVSISKKTNFVIVGEKAGPSKMAKIIALQEAGHPIFILNEVQFLAELQK